jgi:hypothetical protein
MYKSEPQQYYHAIHLQSIDNKYFIANSFQIYSHGTIEQIFQYDARDGLG